MNYLDVCARAVAAGDRSAQSALDGIGDVLNARGATFTLEYPCPTTAGERWFLMQVVPIDCGAGRVVVWHTDVTARRTAEHAARDAAHANERLLHSFYDGAPLMMGVVALTGERVTVVDLNPAAQRVLGTDRTSGPHANPLETLWPAYCRQCQAERRPVPFQFELIDTRGPRWIDATIASLDEARDECALFSFVADDVTERRQLEVQLLDADRRKDRFLAVLAHELRNPLAPIRNGLEVLRLTQARDAALAGTLNMMDRQLKHLVRLVDDLLDVSRISRGKITLRRQNVRLDDIVVSSVEACRPIIEAHGQTLAVDLALDHAVVYGDPDRLAQVFSNLLTNAAKYGKRGAAVRLRACTSTDEAVIQVMDAGIGIAPEDLDRVFDLFAQIGGNRDLSEGGMGIGLSLVRALVRMHGGRVYAESGGRGTGSTFVVHLPVVNEGLTTADSNATQPIGTALPTRVLVVDDNVDAAESLAALLRLHGHVVQIAHDGIEALERAEADPPEVVFIDLGMPRMDGLEATLKLRQLEPTREIFVVALTGWGQAADRLRTQAAGFDMHLVKPITEEGLAHVFTTSVARRARQA